MNGSDSITLPKGCKPSKVASTDKSRPHLCHGRLVKRDGTMWLCTTNSYVAAAVAVDGPAEEGWMPIQVVKLLEGRRAGKVIEQEDDRTWRVTNPDGTATTHAVQAEIASFPDLAKVDLWEDFKASATAEFGFNADYAAALAAALGGAVRVVCRDPLKAIQFRTLTSGPLARGLLMPIRLSV